jgi:hypothetical protein
MERVRFRFRVILNLCHNMRQNIASGAAVPGRLDGLIPGAQLWDSRSL